MNKKVFIMQDNIISQHLSYNNGVVERTSSNIMRVKSEEINVNKPLIFLKKRKANIKIIPLKILITDTGQTRHYPSAVQEWDNNVYSYNNNYSKLLTLADNSLMKIVKSYFSLNFKKKNKKKINYTIKEHISKYRKSRRRKYLKKKRLSLNKILIAKGNVKHTSSSAIITLYVYNLEKKILINKEKIYEEELNKWLKWKIIEKKIELFKSIDEIVNKEKKRLDEFIVNKVKIIKKKLKKNQISDDIYYKYLNKYKYLDKYKWSKNGLNNLKIVLFQNDLHFKKAVTLSIYREKLIHSNNNKIINDLIKYIKNLLEKKKILKNRYLRLLILNKKKFDKSFIENIRNIACNIYNKEVIFNIINLNKFYLNSNIYAQIISWKLRNRANNINNVLTRSLENINIPYIYKWKANIDKTKLIINKIRNKNVYSLLSNKTSKDWLNEILLKFYPLINPNIKTIKQKKLHDSFEKLIRKSLKHQTLAGIRVEIRGRLTRRFKASRSVYKLKWIGGLRNIDSSFRALSAVILRGHKKSNVDYTVLSSKRRIGTFGVKGWVSSM